MQIGLLQAFQLEFAAHQSLQVATVDLEHLDGVVFQRSIRDRIDILVECFGQDECGFDFDLLGDLGVREQESRHVAVGGQFQASAFDKLDILFQAMEPGVCLILAFGFQRAFELAASEAEADVVIARGVCLQPSHVTVLRLV